MNILYVCADAGISIRGAKGASAHLRNITAVLARRGHRVTVLVRRDGGSNVPSVTWELLDADGHVQAAQISEILARDRIELIIERYSLDSGAASHVARATRTPLFMEVNAPLVDEAARFRGLGDRDTWLAWEADTLRSADHILAVSSGVAQHVVDCGVTGERVTVVANGVDAGRFTRPRNHQLRQKLGLGDAFTVGFCGSMKPWHGVEDLVSSMVHLPQEFRLLLVGDGPDRQRLQSQVERSGLAARVVMTGGVAQDDVPDYLSVLDVAVAPYRAMENFYFSPLKVVEYLAAGLPVVATDQGEMRDMHPPLRLVPPESPRAIARAVLAFAGDADMRRLAAEAGLRLAAQRSWDAVAATIESLAAHPTPA